MLLISRIVDTIHWTSKIRHTQANKTSHFNENIKMRLQSYELLKRTLCIDTDQVQLSQR